MNTFNLWKYSQATSQLSLSSLFEYRIDVQLIHLHGFIFLLLIVINILNHSLLIYLNAKRIASILHLCICFSKVGPWNLECTLHPIWHSFVGCTRISVLTFTFEIEPRTLHFKGLTRYSLSY